MPPERITVDINADVGEGIPGDEKLLPFISSVNIACGAHAGDQETMIRLIQAAQKTGIAIGAHPAYPDRENFGRKELEMEPSTLFDSLISQINTLGDYCRAEGAVLRHVKPHGALYNRAARDPAIAALVAAAVIAVNPSLLLYGLAGSLMLETASRNGLQAVSEVFADRAYNSDGSLVNRSQPGAMIMNSAAAAAQCISMIRYGTVRAINGEMISLRADTVCLHGDQPDALAFARTINTALKQDGIFIQPPF